MSEEPKSTPAMSWIGKAALWIVTAAGAGIGAHQVSPSFFEQQSYTILASRVDTIARFTGSLNDRLNAREERINTKFDIIDEKLDKIMERLPPMHALDLLIPKKHTALHTDKPRYQQGG